MVAYINLQHFAHKMQLSLSVTGCKLLIVKSHYMKVCVKVVLFHGLSQREMLTSLRKVIQFATYL